MAETLVTVDYKKLEETLTYFEKREMPYAVRKTLNQTAIQAQEMAVEQAKSVFENRKKWWVKGSRKTGIRVQFENDRTKPVNQLSTATYTNVYFGERQEKGEIRRPSVGRKYLGVPDDDLAKKYKKSDAIGKLLNNDPRKKKAFIARTKSGQLGVWRRKTKKRYPLEKLFFFHKVTRTEERFDYIETVSVAAAQRFADNFNINLERAVATSRYLT